MIQKIKIDFTNCFGIRKLVHELSFEKGHVHLFYAPNGTMKTSFAKTMRYLSGQSKDKPCDLLHKERIASFSVTSDNNNISEENLFVINGDEELDSSKSFINFLASTELKAKYDEIYQKLTNDKDTLMTKLKGIAQSSNCEDEIVETFSTNENDSIFNILENIYQHIGTNVPMFDFRYNDVFDKKGAVKSFLDSHKNSLKEYIDNYEKLIGDSELFRSVGNYTFGTYQASQLSQYVSDGIFFGVKHKIILQNGEEITSHKQLETIILNEQERIINDSALKKVFDKITKAIDKNVELRGFKSVIECHPEWIAEITKYDEFKHKVWYGYLSHQDIKPLFDTYIRTYESNKNELLDVLQKANKQQERWVSIIDLYNSRFHVPIKVSIVNQRDIILKKEAAKLQFSYVELGCPSVAKNKTELEKILSKGEKRAFTILQFIFEAEARKASLQDTIFVMDDIADSFDYQNKYAIIEYIKDLAEKANGKFYMLILTHNYDFYRTVSSRLNLNRDNLWMIERNKNGELSINQGQYKGDIYSNVFIGHDDEDKTFISMIPFVRNLVEYTKGSQSDDYMTLTKCLHLKPGSNDVAETEVLNIIKNYTQNKGTKRSASTNKIIDLIKNTADGIAQESSPDCILIQNKIVLSMAIRLKAEQYLHDKLIQAGKTEEELSSVKGAQTGKWTGWYNKLCPNDDNKYIIERVNIMTPEAIHINSFMFEPLIDMSIYHLVALYNDCKDKLNI